MYKEAKIETIVPRKSNGYEVYYNGDLHEYDTLSISYEPAEKIYIDATDGSGEQILFADEPAQAILLFTECCPTNHHHIEMTKEQAHKLILWLLKFVEGVYDGLGI